MDIVVDGCCLLAGCQKAQTADEIERLRQQNAELVEVLKLALASHGVVLTSDPPQDAWKANGVAEKARAAIAKATGCK